jgi:hypothetical protein
MRSKARVRARTGALLCLAPLGGCSRDFYCNGARLALPALRRSCSAAALWQFQPLAFSNSTQMWARSAVAVEIANTRNSLLFPFLEYIFGIWEKG